MAFKQAISLSIDPKVHFTELAHLRPK